MTELAQINEHSTEIANLENQTETIRSFSCPSQNPLSPSRWVAEVNKATQ